MHYTSHVAKIAFSSTDRKLNLLQPAYQGITHGNAIAHPTKKEIVIPVG